MRALPDSAPAGRRTRPTEQITGPSDPVPGRRLGFGNGLQRLPALPLATISSRPRGVRRNSYAGSSGFPSESDASATSVSSVTSGWTICLKLTARRLTLSVSARRRKRIHVRGPFQFTACAKLHAEVVSRRAPVPDLRPRTPAVCVISNNDR